MADMDIGIIVDVLNKERQGAFEILDDNLEAFRGTVTIHGIKYAMKFDCSNHFPLEFPDVYVEDQPYFIPHIDKNGKICLFDDSSVLLKTNMVAEIVLDAYDRAVEILSIRPDSKEYIQEVSREFNTYWAGRTAFIVFTCLSQCIGNDYRIVSVVFSEHKFLVADSINEAEVLLNNNFGVSTNNKSVIPGVLIRLRELSIPPIKECYSWKWLRTFIAKNITGSQKRKFNRFLNKCCKRVNQFIFLSIPTQRRDILVGFWLHNECNISKSIKNMTEIKIKPIMLRPIDNDYMLQRGGSSTNLKDKSVLLLGCGSLGGYIAANLCQAGVCNLDILDKDIFSIDNVHRHILGFDFAIQCKNKADLLKKYLEKQYPFVNIDSLNYKDRSAESLITRVDRLGNYDLIVSALGEPTINLEINRLLQLYKIRVPFIVCFNEPYGIGGHVISTNVKQNGCLQCMYTDLLSNELVEFRASFVAHGQNFRKSISGCAGSFVEYSALDSQQTAILATRLAIEVLNGSCEDNILYSWYGPQDNLVKNGFDVSDFYKVRCSQTNSNGYIKMCVPKNERCPICNKKEE